MKARVLYRISSVLILLFDLGHSAGYPWSDPAWGVDTGPMRSSHFVVLGFSRTYWHFYVGFGLTISVFLLLAAILAWQLGGLFMRGTAWALCFSFAAMTVLNCLYFFTIPIVFSGVITVCLGLAAWLADPVKAQAAALPGTSGSSRAPARP